MNRAVSLLVMMIGVFVLSGCLMGSQAPAPVTYYGQVGGEGSAGVHNVVEGDTLWSVSNRYKIPMSDIAIVNNVRAPFALKPGQRLKLPPPRTYKVKAGDTIYSVSRLFDVNQYDIARQNDLRSPYTIHQGQLLRLPSEEGRQAREEEQGNAPVRLTQVDRTDLSAPSDGAVRPSKKPVADSNKPGYVKPTSKPKIAQKTRPKSKITAKTPKRSSSKFLQPVKGKVISNYGPKKGGLHNDGINIAAPRGTPIRAAENGVVVYAGSELKGSGNLVLVRHSDRWMTAYAHMDKFAVKRGDVIKRGAKLGTVGSTGSVSKPQLHFEVRRGTEAINPKRYMSNG